MFADALKPSVARFKHQPHTFVVFFFVPVRSRETGGWWSSTRSFRFRHFSILGKLLFRPPAAAALLLLLLLLESNASLKGQAPTLIMLISYELTVQYYTQVQDTGARLFFMISEQDTTLTNYNIPHRFLFSTQSV